MNSFEILVFKKVFRVFVKKFEVLFGSILDSILNIDFHLFGTL